MDATRDHPAWHHSTLHPSLEELLSSYAASIGGSQGVPCEILQSATVVPEGCGEVTMQGPASCTEDVDTKDGEDNDESQCAAVLHGGVDDVGPVQLWNAVMKKYKVAQACEKELSKLNAKVKKTG